MVYVRDKTVWQYKVLTRDLVQGPNEEEFEHAGQGRLGVCSGGAACRRCALLLQED
jgi:hypothetical protein